MLPICAVELAAAGDRRGVVHLQLGALDLLLAACRPSATGGDRLTAATAAVHRRRSSRTCRGRKPWWAISRVSVATFGVSRFRLGPVQRTGMTPYSAHSATTRSSIVIAEITMVVGLTPFDHAGEPLVSFTLSSPIGRVSLTLVYFIRVGSCQTMRVVAALFALLEHDLEAESLAAVEDAEAARRRWSR